MIYLDNAATTWPKPEGVYQAVEDCMRNYAANPGRSGHKMALKAAREIFETRLLLAELFHIQDETRIVFTGNATEALNLALKGVLKSGDHVLISAMEHNSVVRPLKALESKGVEMSIIPCDGAGRLDIQALEEQIRPQTRLIALTHASNLTGTLMPIKKVGALAESRGILFLVDAAQSAGIYEINVEENHIDLLAAPGHKGLFGPQGTGFLYIRPGLELATLKEGGTGSKSSEILQPDLMPDRHESGTLNTPGIVGLKAGLQFIKEQGLADIRSRSQRLTAYLLEGLQAIKGLTLYGPGNCREQGGVAAFNLEGMDCSQLAFLLDSRYDIYGRSGLHCTPLAHGSIGTEKIGAMRLSLGYFNTETEIARTLQALKEIRQSI